MPAAAPAAAAPAPAPAAGVGVRGRRAPSGGTSCCCCRSGCCCCRPAGGGRRVRRRVASIQGVGGATAAAACAIVGRRRHGVAIGPGRRVGLCVWGVCGWTVGVSRGGTRQAGICVGSAVSRPPRAPRPCAPSARRHQHTCRVRRDTETLVSRQRAALTWPYPHIWSLCCVPRFCLRTTPLPWRFSFSGRVCVRPPARAHTPLHPAWAPSAHTHTPPASTRTPAPRSVGGFCVFGQNARGLRFGNSRASLSPFGPRLASHGALVRAA